MTRLVRLAILAIPAALVLAIVPGGCERGPAASSPPPMMVPVTVRAERGPVTLVVEAARSHVTVGEPLDLTVMVRSTSGVEVELPQPAEKLGEFEVLDVRTPPDLPDGDQRVWKRTYRVSTLESGDLEIPPVTIRFTDRREVPEARTADGRPVEGELATEPLVVIVQSLVGADFDPADLRAIKGTVAVETPASGLPPWLGVAIAIVALIGAIAGAVAAWRRRAARRAEAEIVVPPDVWARAELDRLEAERLPENDRWHEFFFRLSGIVREYIERRFAIHAPEQTTQEFIRAVRGNRQFDESQRRLLADFLRAADMVKFALHEPPRVECDRSLSTARDFVEQTVPRDPDPDPAQDPDRDQAQDQAA